MLHSEGLSKRELGQVVLAKFCLQNLQVTLQAYLHELCLEHN